MDDTIALVFYVKTKEYISWKCKIEDVFYF